jgi:hypothetical protein
MDFGKGGFQILGDVPARIMGLHLLQVRDVANMVAFPVLVHVFILHRFGGDGFNQSERLQDGNAVRTSSAEIIELADALGHNKPAHELHHVMAMNVVPHLFALG